MNDKSNTMFSGLSRLGRINLIVVSCLSLLLSLYYILHNNYLSQSGTIAIVSLLLALLTFMAAYKAPAIKRHITRRNAAAVAFVLLSWSALSFGLKYALVSFDLSQCAKYSAMLRENTTEEYDLYSKFEILEQQGALPELLLGDEIIFHQLEYGRFLMFAAVFNNQVYYYDSEKDEWEIVVRPGE